MAKIDKEWNLIIQETDFHIEKSEDGTFFVNILQDEGYDQQCIQLHSSTKEELSQLRDKLNEVLESE